MNDTQNNPASFGSVVSIIVILALIILGGLYFWGKRIEEARIEKALTSETAQNNQANVIQSTGTPDDLNSLDADLKAVDTTRLTTELGTTTK